jgi:hypothetical protein
MTAADAPSNVVSIRTAAPSASVREREWSDKKAQCEHKAITIDSSEPVIECRDCGAIVDPYRWIRDRCRDWSRWIDNEQYRQREMRDETKRLQAALRLVRKEYRDEQERRVAEREIMVLPGRMQAP